MAPRTLAKARRRPSWKPTELKSSSTPPDIQGSSAEVEAKIRRAAELFRAAEPPQDPATGSTATAGMIVLSGGEPTIRPELLRWADLVASLGMDLGLVTNGLLLAYPERVDALVRRSPGEEALRSRLDVTTIFRPP